MWSVATSHMLAASSPSTMEIQPSACMPSSSRSTGRSIWMSGATRSRRHLPASPPTWRSSRQGSPTSPLTSCVPIAPPRSNTSRRDAAKRIRRMGAARSRQAAQVREETPGRKQYRCKNAKSILQRNNGSASHNRQAYKLGKPQEQATLQKRKKMGRSPIGKRPKSREETPKEGSGSAKRYRTAIYDRFDSKYKGC